MASSDDYNENGYDENSYDEKGYDEDGYDEDGCDEYGFNKCAYYDDDDDADDKNTKEQHIPPPDTRLVYREGNETNEDNSNNDNCIETYRNDGRTKTIYTKQEAYCKQCRRNAWKRVPGALIGWPFFFGTVGLICGFIIGGIGELFVTGETTTTDTAISIGCFVGIIIGFTIGVYNIKKEL